MPGRWLARRQQQRCFDHIGAAECVSEGSDDHVRDAGDDPRSKHDAGARPPSRGADLLVRGPPPELH